MEAHEEECINRSVGVNEGVKSVGTKPMHQRETSNDEEECHKQSFTAKKALIPLRKAVC